MRAPTSRQPSFASSKEALEPNPAQRFQTAGELEQALEDPAGELRVDSRSAWRGRSVYTAAALAVSVILVAALTILWSPQPVINATDRTPLLPPQSPVSLRESSYRR
jgi:hypothetical protein